MTAECSQRTVLVTTEEPLVVNLLKRYLDGYQIVGVSRADLEEGIRKYMPWAVIFNEGLEGREAQVFSPEEADGEHAVLWQLPRFYCALPDPAFLRASLEVDHYLVKPVTRERILELLAPYGPEVQDVLVIDDDLQLATLLARFVRSAPGPHTYTVDMACGGQEGIDRLKVHPPDLVLLDLMMADVPGLDVIKYIRSQPDLQGVHIAVVTARDLPDGDIELLPEKVLALRGPDSFNVVNLLNCLRAMLDEVPPCPVLPPETMP
jgi:CheY-like chemotaxis protein